MPLGLIIGQAEHCYEARSVINAIVSEYRRELTGENVTVEDVFEAIREDTGQDFFKAATAFDQYKVSFVKSKEKFLWCAPDNTWSLLSAPMVKEQLRLVYGLEDSIPKDKPRSAQDLGFLANNFLRNNLERIAILHRLSVLLEGKREHFGLQIAREGGKPLTDALIEVDRAINGVWNAADMLRVAAGQEIPMGLTRASVDRRAFTIREPIRVRLSNPGR